jgi:hypothetical protein
MNMRRICCFVLGAVTTVVFSACGSDEGTGKGTGGSASGNSSTGGIGSGTGGAGTGTTGGSGTGTTGGSGTTGGTGASTGGSGGAATSGACQTACQKLLTAKCGDITQADCTNGCAPATACNTESDAFYGCINSKGTVSCENMISLVAGCNAEDTALSLCTVCLPHDGDNSCVACTRSTCCSQVKTYITAADAPEYDACIEPCPDATDPAACYDACATKFPTAGKADAAISDCQVKSCATGCVCGPAADDLACDTCVKTNCCADYTAYVTATDAAAFSACLNACTTVDQACFDDCSGKSPVAGAAYEKLITECVATTCDTACM